MKPAFVLQSLACLMFVATITYFFFIPPALLEKNSDKNLPGYWGEPNGEFDWCEANYRLGPYIAEPWNTATGLSYIAVAAVSLPYYYRLSKRHNLQLRPIFIFMFMLFPLAIATFLFHATLQYEHQLLDEISMYYIITYGFGMVCCHCNPDSWLYYSSIGCNPLNAIQYGYASVVGAETWYTRTDRDGDAHQIMRGAMTVTFSVMFVYIFYSGAWMSAHCGKACERLFDQCYGIWIVSICCWLMDNVFCDLLRNDLIIPYLNYHGTVWHLGSCLGIHYMLHVFMAFGLEEYGGVKPEIEWFCFIFPYLTIPSQKIEKKRQ